MTTENIVDVATKFEKAVVNILSQDFRDIVSVVVGAVGSEKYSPRPGYNADDGYLWNKVEFVNKNIAPCFNQEIQADWKKIYTFLHEKVGKCVFEHLAKEAEKQKVVDSIAMENNLNVIWSMPIPKDFEAMYLPHVSSIHYDTNSGWGNPYAVKVDGPLTYLQLWKIANELVVKSGDSHHIFLESVHKKGKSDDYSLSLGS